MANNDRNTLNDVKYTDANVSSTIQRQGDLPPSVGNEYDHVFSTFKKISI